MRLRACLLSAATLSATISFGIAAMAADLPREGTIKVTYAGQGTFKPYSIGKDRLLMSWDENGLSVGEGIEDHLTWHCFGTGDFINGTGLGRGYCVGTDPAGDQVVGEVADEKGPPERKIWNGSGKYTSGTGKFAGITGEFTYSVHSGDFRPAAEGTYVVYGDVEGSYKLPPLTQ